MFIQLVAFITVISPFVDAQIINSFMNRRPCRSLNGEFGECKAVSNCPMVRWDIRKQRQYSCFRNILSIGVCCPSKTTSAQMVSFTWIN